ncbi:hypothetical protein CRE_07350 [Caenorhabditis remanei]|uniref:Uncharacterized protein n=1 Tax=Caenorhabditis remanei TaxID=31234 RepID=E3M2D1_CAERE|nr:hypothetical protein CRE_07350 [Caenorhabditis remanei]
MTVRIKMEVPQDLVTKMKSLNDRSLQEQCEKEIEKHVFYLETVLKGWKTYKNVKKEHSRILFLMLKTDNEDALRDYEKLVLYPKMLERVTAEQKEIEKEHVKATNVESPSSVVELGAESTNGSIGIESGSQSPMEDLHCERAIVYERVDLPEVLVQNYEEQLAIRKMITEAEERIARNEQTTYVSSAAVTTTVSVHDIPLPSTGDPTPPTQLQYLRHIVHHVEAEIEPCSSEDLSVTGVAFNSALSENIAKAAAQVRQALDNVEKMDAESMDDVKNTITKMNLLKLESKLKQSANEVQQRASKEWKHNENLSKGMKKRMKKAAKKAADALDFERKLIEDKEERIRQCHLAAEAVNVLTHKKTAALAKKEKNPLEAEEKVEKKVEKTVEKKEEKKSENHLEELPMTEVELKLLFEILTRKSADFEPGSEDERVYQKYRENQSVLEAHIIKNCSLEYIANTRLLGQLREMTDEVYVPTKIPTKSKEQLMDEAEKYIIQKLNYWKNSDHSQAQHYVNMYKYFLANCGYTIANIIVGYMPYENLPNAEFETTMLLQYQAGKFFPDEGKGSS